MWMRLDRAARLPLLLPAHRLGYGDYLHDLVSWFAWEFGDEPEPSKATS
jgi:hypothetical protein